MTSERERSEPPMWLPKWRLALHETFAYPELVEQRTRAELREEGQRAQLLQQRAQERALEREWLALERGRLIHTRLLEERAQFEEHARFEAVEERARSPHFLLATAVRLLPPSERARYFEEFRAELLGLPRDARLRHALSLLRGVFVLRVRRGLKTTTDDAVRRVDG